MRLPSLCAGSPSTSGSPSDLCSKVRVHKKVRQLSKQTRRTSTSTDKKVSPVKPCRLLPSRESVVKVGLKSFRESVRKPPRSKKEVYFPPILQQDRRRPDSKVSKGLPRTIERVKLPPIGKTIFFLIILIHKYSQGTHHGLIKLATAYTLTLKTAEHGQRQRESSWTVKAI